MLQPSARNICYVFWIFLKLGCTSFGGPIAHLGYFRQAFVVKHQWLTEKSYADLVALCQFLPGPASSQVGMAIGWYRAGILGSIAAWLGFTMPSALLLILFALGLSHYPDLIPMGVIHGLKILAVAVVFQAIWGMARNLTPDAPRISIMIVSACAVLLSPTIWMQLIVMIVAALIGIKLFAQVSQPSISKIAYSPAQQRVGVGFLTVFMLLLLGLPVLSNFMPSQSLAMFDAFYRTGSLVFGGGHVVLPLLQAQTVNPGWVNNEVFLAGYGATQAVPGPLFTFAAFLGASMTRSPTGWVGGLLALVAIFLPSFFLVVGTLPFWERLREHTTVQSALIAVNASTVGLLLATLYEPVWVNAILNPSDFALALLAVAALMVWKLPVWLVVTVCAGLGIVLPWFTAMI